MADPTLNQLAHENMGHVSKKVKEYSTKPIVPTRKSRSNIAIVDMTQNGNINREVSPTFGSRGRVVEKRNKFRRSEPPSMVPSFSQRVDSDTKVGSAAVMVSSETSQEQILPKVVCEQKFETVTEMPSSNTELQISDNSSTACYSPLSRLSSPEILDSSFDETSDEDVMTDRVMGKDIEPKPYSLPPPIKFEKIRSRTRERSSVIVKSTGVSLSPVEHRKYLQSLSDSFRPSSSVSSSGSSSSISRSQTFTDKSSQRMHRLQGSPLATRYSTTVDTESPNSTTMLAENFVFLEPQEV